MAADAALLQMAKEPVLRVYGWECPMVSVGIRFSMKGLSGELARLPVVRRPTGGGIVWHGEDQTFTLVVPEAERLAGFDPRSSYRWIHSRLARALTEFTRETFVLADDEATLPDSRCFQSPVNWDVMKDGRKVAGGAQRRTRTGFLHQGSVLGVHLDSGFWRSFAGALADRVEEHALSADLMAETAQLETEQYAMPEWFRPANIQTAI